MLQINANNEINYSNMIHTHYTHSISMKYTLYNKYITYNNNMICWNPYGFDELDTATNGKKAFS